MTINLPEVRFGDVTLFYDGRAGSEIKDIIRDAWLVSLKTGCPIRIDLNGFARVLTEHTVTDDILRAYYARNAGASL